jgi:hypothetical protein
MVKQEKKVVQEVEPPPAQPLERKQFSDEFLDMMFDYAYEALYQHLVAVDAAPEAREMLENLVVLHVTQQVYARNPLVAFHWNDSAGETIGRISKLILSMGGHFSGAPQNMITRDRLKGSRFAGAHKITE